jgi:1-acyl-sn-glycerol-3-phosphate acyltransferase
LLYHVVHIILRFLFLLLTKRRITGRENIPSQGPAIFVGNHIHLIDSPLLGISLGRRVQFMAKEEMFHSRITGYFMTIFGAFPVAKGRLDMKAFRQAFQILSDGQTLVIFPEGMRSKNYRLKLAFPGAALIASRTDTPIIPVVITGTEKVKGIKWLWQRPVITVSIGPPFTLPQVKGRLTKFTLAKLTDIIMEHIAQLLPIEYHGQYSTQEAK